MCYVKIYVCFGRFVQHVSKVSSFALSTYLHGYYGVTQITGYLLEKLLLLTSVQFSSVTQS